MKDINVVSVQPGDILLFPAEMGFYQEIAQKFGKKVADIAFWLADSKYLHAEIVYDGNIVLAATGNGTYILERSMKEL